MVFKRSHFLKYIIVLSKHIKCSVIPLVKTLNWISRIGEILTNNTSSDFVVLSKQFYYIIYVSKHLFIKRATLIKSTPLVNKKVARL